MSTNIQNTKNTSNNNSLTNQNSISSTSTPSTSSTSSTSSLTQNTSSNISRNISFTDNTKNKISSLYKNASNTIKQSVNTTINNSDLLIFIFKLLLTIIVLIAIFYVSKYYYNKYIEMVYNSPYLLNNIKNAKRPLVINQDPKNVNYIPISRSDGQDGIQFTYDFWLLIETFDYKPGEWKHIFHKGNASGYPNRAPGVWLHPSNNAIRFYMNTQENILEYIDIDNIPARKWLHFALVLDDKDMDIYVNGFLKARKKLSSIPKQNNGDFWCNMFGGFEGYMSRIRYYPRAIMTDEIIDNVRKGPGNTKCLEGNDTPAYLDDNWWYN